MYLKNIEVHGFKSFAQKINFEFHNGITGIVGPNGSGKSNVGDAVRWVLGEQSAKQLRGGNMQDVIFSGTETRKPLSFASVAITLDNSDHKLPVDFNEVTVTRRLYRSGESEYLINGSACRLKDINEMFYDTGIGKEGYSIIGQGQIDKILSGKPDERRELYPLIGVERVAEIFAYLDDAEPYLKELPIESAAKIVSEMDSDDAVDVLEEMDATTKHKIVGMLDKEASEDVRLLFSYDEDEIGSYMTTNLILIHNDLTVREAMRELVRQAGENDNISTIYVVDRQEQYYGAIELQDLIIAREHVELEDLISRSYPFVMDHEKISDCIEKIKDYAEDSIPVLLEDRSIGGIITAQDIVEVVDDEMGDDYAKLAGLTAEEDLNETTGESIRKRLPWLVILLFLGMVVSAVVGVFESVVAVLPIVMCFQSLILDMAGNVGTQSLAVTIRVLMDESLTGKQKLVDTGGRVDRFKKRFGMDK